RSLEPVKAETRASAIRIGNPASWKKTVRILEANGGWCEQVNEREIALAKAQIGAEGIGCEPASAVTLAGLKKLVAAGHVGTEETAVLLLTGHTLKDSEYTIQYHRGQLFNEAELAEASRDELDQHAALQHAPVVLDANVDDVLRALDNVAATAGQIA
ncbi:MAG TPA: pyridoxal-phosphate dependent enzyme, partial [Granulicella sp.]